MKAKEVIEMFNNSALKARHGDVVLLKVDRHFETEGEVGKVVAEGEATGHAHRIMDKAEVKKVSGAVDQMLVKVLENTEILHEEHDDGPLEKGTYVSGIQRQYNPAGWTRVVD